MSTKKTLIVLPGWGGSQETWADFVQMVPSTIDIHVIDMPCFGTEPCPRAVWSIEDYAYFAKKRIESITHGEPFALLGHSFGGQIASYLCAKRMVHADKLILLASATVRPRRLIKRVVIGAMTKLGKFAFSVPGLRSAAQSTRRIWYRIVGAPEFGDLSGIKGQIFQRVTRQDMRTLLPLIKQQTLCVWGAQDTMTPLKHGVTTAGLIPNADLIIEPEGKHGLHHTHIKELWSHIEHFLYVSND